MNRKGRPSVLRSSILLALASCKNQLGMTSAELAAAANWEPHLTKQTLHAMVKDGRVFVLGTQKCARYFGSAERRDAAVPEFNALMETIKAQQREAAKQSQKRRDQRRLARLKAARRERPAKAERPPKTPKACARHALLDLIVAFDDPLGMSFEDLRKAGVQVDASTAKSISILIERRKIFAHGVYHWRRLFATEEARDAAAPILETMQAENAARLRKKNNDKKNAKRAAARAAARANNVQKPEPAKPPKEAKPKRSPTMLRRSSKNGPGPAHAAPVHIKVPSTAAFKDLPAVNPNNVKPTVLPGFKPRTFEPPKWFKGELTREWQELRSQRETA